MRTLTAMLVVLVFGALLQAADGASDWQQGFAQTGRLTILATLYGLAEELQGPRYPKTAGWLPIEIGESATDVEYVRIYSHPATDAPNYVDLQSRNMRQFDRPVERWFASQETIQTTGRQGRQPDTSYPSTCASPFPLVAECFQEDKLSRTCATVRQGRQPDTSYRSTCASPFPLVAECFQEDKLSRTCATGRQGRQPDTSYRSTCASPLPLVAECFQEDKLLPTRRTEPTNGSELLAATCRAAEFLGFPPPTLSTVVFEDGSRTHDSISVDTQRFQKGQGEGWIINWSSIDIEFLRHRCYLPNCADELIRPPQPTSSVTGEYCHEGHLPTQPPAAFYSLSWRTGSLLMPTSGFVQSAP